MKAITLIQPWATLIALGEKRIETRSWSTNYQEEIAIYAGKKIDRHVFERLFCFKVFQRYSITSSNIINSSTIAACNLAEIRKTEDW